MTTNNPEITDLYLAKVKAGMEKHSDISTAEIDRKYLLAMVEDLIQLRAMRAMTVQYPYETPRGHADALADSGEAYSQHNGWTLNCLWCDYPSQGKTKTEALAGMQKHYDSLGINAELS